MVLRSTTSVIRTLHLLYYVLNSSFNFNSYFKREPHLEAFMASSDFLAFSFSYFIFSHVLSTQISLVLLLTCDKGK